MRIVLENEICNIEPYEWKIWFDDNLVECKQEEDVFIAEMEDSNETIFVRCELSNKVFSNKIEVFDIIVN